MDPDSADHTLIARGCERQSLDKLGTLSLSKGKSKIANGARCPNRKSQIANCKWELAMDEDELKRRTKRFALQVMALVGSLPITTVGRAIGGQLVRSGTSVGANYRAACRGRSKAEFSAKLGTVEEEADESSYWMELIIEGKLMKEERVLPLLREANEIAAIMAASRKTMARRR
jgi:four helix bundle protein